MSKHPTNHAAKPATDNSEGPSTPCRLMQQRNSVYELLGDSPGQASINDEAICSTPPQAAHRMSNISHNHTPELDFGRQSPVIMSMTQRAMKLGVDVIWASSPTRRSASPLIDRKIPTPPVGLYASSPTAIVRRKSIKERKNTNESKSPKKGLYKFQEDLKSIMPFLRGRIPDSVGESSSVLESETPNASANRCSAFSEATVLSPISTIHISNKRSGSQDEKKTPAKFAKNENQQKNYILSTSIQNEFMDDSEFDMVLFQSSQDIENRIQIEEQNANTNKPQTIKTPRPIPLSKPHLFIDNFPENDSIDEFMSSKELDQLISSQASLVQPTSKPLIERHKSMPECTSLLNISDDILNEFSDERLNELIASSSSGYISNSRSTQLERHNSMPVSPFAESRPTMATKRRLLHSFEKPDPVVELSSDDSDP